MKQKLAFTNGVFLYPRSIVNGTKDEDASKEMPAHFFVQNYTDI